MGAVKCGRGGAGRDGRKVRVANMMTVIHVSPLGIQLSALTRWVAGEGER